MRRAWRYAPYFVLVLAAVGLLGWFRVEQSRAEHQLNSTYEFYEPDWSQHLPRIRQAIARQPTEEAKLAALAEMLTMPYRNENAPLRFKAIKEADGTLALRLNAAVVVPRWYTARAARLAHTEARQLLGREVPIHIYETYIVGRSRLIGFCREHAGTVEVAFR